MGWKRELVKGKKAQGMTEYILIVALIAILAIAGVRIFGSRISQIFKGQATQIGNEAGIDENGNPIKK
jgi:pilus assembly protein Flp/PilA